MMEKNYTKEEFIYFIEQLFLNNETDNILDKLIIEFNLAGRHTASRRIKKYFGKSFYDLCKEYKKKQFITTNIKDISFKDFLAIELSNVNNINYGPLVMKCTKRFSITKREFHKRFKSYYHESIKDYLIKVLEPTKEEIQKAFLLNNNVEDFFEYLKITKKSDIRASFFQRHFNCSTFTTAKAKFQYSREYKKYTPTKDDNLSLLYSQYIGDGSYDKVRNSFKIEHGIAQYDYLVLKVKLFNKAFPNTNGLEKLHKKVHGTQNFEFCSWYSKKLPDFVILSKEKMIEKMTPLGIMLLYLDDGCLHKHCLNISSKDKNVLNALKEKMISYGINGNVNDKVYAITKLSEVIKFLHSFIMPYEDIIPPCMAYKYNLKI